MLILYMSKFETYTYGNSFHFVVPLQNRPGAHITVSRRIVLFQSVHQCFDVEVEIIINMTVPPTVRNSN